MGKTAGERLRRLFRGSAVVSLSSDAVDSPLTLEGRLAQLTDLMGQSSILVEQVSAELDATAATARKLQEEAASAEALAAMNRDQAEAVRRLLDAELATKLAENSAGIRKDVRKDALKIGLGSFVAGGGLTYLVTLLVHPLH